jgi:signal transduction histidine kinase
MFELLLSPVQAASGFLCIASIRELTGQKRSTEQVWRAAVFQERARMARHVHDTLAQGFACVLLHLEAVDELAACLPEEV